MSPTLDQNIIMQKANMVSSGGKDIQLSLCAISLYVTMNARMVWIYRKEWSRPTEVLYYTERKIKAITLYYVITLK